MSRVPKVICLVVFTVGSAFAQKASKAPEPAVDSRTNLHPVIFQRTAPAVEATASLSSAQLAQASFRLAAEDEVDGMERTLGGYVRAFEDLNIAEVKQVWPDIDRQHATAFKDLFAGFKGVSTSPRLVLQCAIPRLSAGTANVECRETITYQSGKGKGTTKELGPVKVSIQMKGESGHWAVSDMRGSD